MGSRRGSSTDVALKVLEAVIGRRMLWKASRRMYLHARRQGSLDIERNGEARLQRLLAARSKRLGQPLTIIDVGANYGQWTTAFLEAIRDAGAPRARFTLFEPVPAIRAKLTASLARHEALAAVTVRPEAVSDKPGTSSFTVTDEAAGDHHLATDRYAHAGNRIEVPIVTLDALWPEIAGGRVDMVKIDAEGFDCRVVAGAREALHRGDIDVIQIEYSALLLRAGDSLLELFELAHRAECRVGLLTEAGIEVFSEWHPEIERFYSSSIVVLHPRVCGELGAREVAFGPDNTYA